MRRAAGWVVALVSGAAGCTGAARPSEASAPSRVEVAAPQDAGAAPASSAQKQAQEDAQAARRVASTLKQVSRARGIPATKDVPSRVLGRQELIEQIKKHVAKEVPPEAIQHEGDGMRLLGVLPATFDYAAATFAMLETQIAGYYEPADATMYLAADLEGEVADATLAHELVHALQDQRWSLEKLSSYQPGQSDRTNAFHALAEGDATSAMLDVMIARVDGHKTALDLPDGVLQQQMSTLSATKGEVPPIMMASLVAPYVEGMRFVHALRKRGGWAAVDAAWKDLPTTSEQILHPEKYLAHEPALTVDAPKVGGLGGAFRSVDEDTTGELGLRLLFASWVGDPGGARLAQGWGGDRCTLASDGAATVLLQRIRFDASKGHPTKAQNVVDTIGRAWKADRLGTVAVWSPTFVCVERPNLGPLAVASKGGDAFVLAGPANLASETPKAAGTCSDLKKWLASEK